MKPKLPIDGETYEYKGMRYQVRATVSVKIYKFWLHTVWYSDDNGSVFVRRLGEFDKRFKKVKKEIRIN